MRPWPSSPAPLYKKPTLSFLVDATSGVTASDQTVADMLRRTDKPISLVANKIDGQNAEIVLSEFFGLGFGAPLAIAASQGRGVAALSDQLLCQFGLLDVEPSDSNEEREDALGSVLAW